MIPTLQLAGLGRFLPPAAAGPTAYQYWRLNISRWEFAGSATTSTGDVRIDEWQLFTPSAVQYPGVQMSSNNSLGYVASASSSSGAGFEAFRAFQLILSDSSRWISASGAGAKWLQIDLGTPRSISSMKIAPDGAATSDGGYHPLDIEVLASNTGSFSGEEVTIYTATNLVTAGWTGNTLRTFTF